MKEADRLLKVISESMKALAQGVAAIAEKIDELAGSPESKPAGRPSPKRASKPASKKAGTGIVKAHTATDAVLKIISRSKKGVNTAALKKKTGFNDKKIHNIIYRLKKTGEIKSVDKGVYVKM